MRIDEIHLGAQVQRGRRQRTRGVVADLQLRARKARCHGIGIERIVDEVQQRRLVEIYVRQVGAGRG